MSCNWHFSNQDCCLIHLEFCIRLREYELDIDSSTRRGPEVERIHFVILEMARKCYLPSVQRSIRCIVHVSEHYYELKYFWAFWDFIPWSFFFFSLLFSVLNFMVIENIFLVKERLEIYVFSRMLSSHL